MLRKLFILLFILTSMFGMIGCEDEGPMEEMGDKVEEAGDELEEATD
jgi:hypothetical protein